MQPQDEQWCSIADLISQSIPNAIISHLGRKFGTLYYKELASSKCSCAFVSTDEFGAINGVVIGTTDHSASYSRINTSKMSLLAAANIRLLKFSVLRWIGLNLMAKMAKLENKNTLSVRAELIAIAVTPDMRGKGLADVLIQKMEQFIAENSQELEYFILTEQDNQRANNYYAKIGSVQVATFLSRGRKINRWHKKVVG